MNKLEKFNRHQIKVVSDAAAMAEEIVSNFYKMSQTQWLNRRYDIKTLKDLEDEEIVDGPFAQIIKYQGKKEHTVLGSSTYDFYKICIQDNSIISVLRQKPEIELPPFILYIITHELIHILRFGKFYQNFDASYFEKMEEETRVHAKTREIIKTITLSGLNHVLNFYKKWDRPFMGS